MRGADDHDRDLKEILEFCCTVRGPLSNLSSVGGRILTDYSHPFELVTFSHWSAHLIVIKVMVVKVIKLKVTCRRPSLPKGA